MMLDSHFSDEPQIRVSQLPVWKSGLNWFFQSGQISPAQSTHAGYQPDSKTDYQGKCATVGSPRPGRASLGATYDSTT